MGTNLSRRAAACLVLALAVAASDCDHHCGLGEHDRITVDSSQTGPTPAGGGAVYRDVALKGATSDPEFTLTNIARPAEAGGVDAFIVATSCGKLFDGPYPGGTPRCSILAGPAKPGGVAPRVKLSPGTYRVYLQGYSNVSQPVNFLVDVYIWDYSCGPLIQ